MWIIPARHVRGVTVFLALWICWWIAGTVVAIGEVPSDQSAFTLGWLGAWLVIGPYVTYVWAWELASQERVTVRSGSLVLSRELLRWSRTREYELQQLSKLRAVPSPSDLWLQYRRLWGLEGRVAFEYRGETVRFGAGLDDAEATVVVAELNAGLSLAA